LYYNHNILDLATPLGKYFFWGSRGAGEAGGAGGAGGGRGAGEVGGEIIETC
jgi:hypothetical protein